MKVLLTQDVEKVGNMGDVVEVKSGFARNYLFPQKVAVEVNPHQLTIVESRKKKIQKKIELEKLSAAEQKDKLQTIVLTLKKKAGENDVLFGSVTAAEIESELQALGIHIERKKIHMEEPIKRLGNYTCKIKLLKDIEADIKIEVVKEGEGTLE